MTDEVNHKCVHRVTNYELLVANLLQSFNSLLVKLTGINVASIIKANLVTNFISIDIC